MIHYSLYNTPLFSPIQLACASITTCLAYLSVSCFLFSSEQSPMVTRLVCFAVDYCLSNTSQQWLEFLFRWAIEQLDSFSLTSFQIDVNTFFKKFFFFLSRSISMSFCRFLVVSTKNSIV